MDFQRTARPLVAGRLGWVGLGWSRTARLDSLAWPGGWAAQGTLQVRPCKLGRRFHAAHAPAHPTRPASDTSWRLRPPRKEKEEQEQEQGQGQKQEQKQEQHSGLFRGQIPFPQEKGSPPTPRRSDRGVDQGRHLPGAARTHRHRETVGGWGGVGWQDRWRHGWRHRAPWVRALCLRSTASQAPERPAASGWAGPRRGGYGASCRPTPPRPTSSNPEPLWLWLWPLQVQGGSPARHHRTPSAALAGHGPALPVMKKPPFGGFLITSA